MTEAVSTESAYRELTITREGAAGRIVLNRPRALNALNDAMRAEITAAIPGVRPRPEHLRTDDQIRGAGRIFGRW